MKITVKIGEAEIVVEAQNPQELSLLGQVVRDIVGVGCLKVASDPEQKQDKQRTLESKLNQARVSAVEWVLATSQSPMSAPEIANEVKEEEVFQTKSGNPIHTVRRVLADAKFEKTLSGLFRLREEVSGVHPQQEDHSINLQQIVPIDDFVPIDDDMDDPFADN